MILVIDNFDSFTYNLVQMIASFGLPVTVVRNNETTVDNVCSAPPAGILISPGPCTPHEAGISLQLCAELTSGALRGVPMLGVCLGYQSLCVSLGATLRPAKTLKHGKTSLVTHDGLGAFEGIASPMLANRYHSLAIEESSLPHELIATSHAIDDGELMGVRHRNFPVEAVLFHPESILTPEGNTLLGNFVQQVTARSRN